MRRLLFGYQRRLAAAGLLALLLAGGTAPAWGQAERPAATITIRERAWPPIPSPLAYLDGRQLDSLGGIDPSAIAHITILKDRAAEAFNPAASGRGIIFITSKRRQNQRAVRRFGQRLQQLQRQYNEYAPPVGNPQPSGVRYYLNGQLVSRAVADTTSGRRVRHFATLRGPRAATYAHDPSVTEVFVIETTTGQP